MSVRFSLEDDFFLGKTGAVGVGGQDGVNVDADELATGCCCSADPAS